MGRMKELTVDAREPAEELTEGAASPIMEHSGDALELDRQVCFALAVANRAVIGIYRPILEPLGLTHPQYLVMLALWEGAPLRFGEIAGLLHLDRATLSPLIKRLEQAGYVQRIPVEGDERTFSLVPTDAGRALRTQALDVPPAVFKRLGLPLERLLALREELAAVISAVEGAVEDTVESAVEGTAETRE